MKAVAIDLGTSFAKLGFFVEDSLIKKEKGVPLEKIRQIVSDFQPERIIVSSVTLPKDEVEKLVPKDIPLLYLTHETPLSVPSEYATPATLGADRRAAVAGAVALFPGTDLLIIDAGTCITIDLVISGVHRGGSISPGMELKFRALHNYTSRLPLMQREPDAALTGKTTGESILSGVINGTIAEISELIRMYQYKFRNLQLVICGGDAEFFSERLKMDIKVVPDLVLTGLNRIQQHNG